MVKKTGNLIILFMMFAVTTHAQDSQSLRVAISDLQHNTVDQVEIGVPFLLKISAENLSSKEQPQGFDAWSNFSVTLYGQNQSTTIVNGDMSQTINFTYVVTPQEKGNFVCPALKMADKNGKIVSSGEVKILVGDAVQIVQHKNVSPYVLQVELDERSVFIGQKITATLRFGYQESFQDLRITESAMTDIYRGYVSSEAKLGKFKIGQEEYSSQDFVMELYPEKLGTLIIPAFQATFSPQRHQQYSSIFSMVMGGGNVVQSQPKSFEVKVLPEHSEFKNVTAIGQFDSMEFKLSSTQAAVGEGLVAKMIVIGDGNLEVVKAPLLEMPEGLHYYEGNGNVTREPNGKFKKEFEWIVQAEHSDSFKIPAQRFVYFDLKRQGYKFLKSQEIEIVIHGSNKKQEKNKTVPPVTQEVENNQLEQKQESSKKTDTSWIDFVALSNAINLKMLAWLIQFLISLICLFAVILFSKKYLKNLFFIETLKIRLQFFSCYKKRDIQGVYKTFETVLSRYGLDMQGSELEKCFIDLKMEDELFQNWKNFVTMIWEMNFAKDRATDQTELAFSLAKQWFVIILSCCKLQKKKQAAQQIIS